jgi:hypothetical protein
MTHEDRTLSTGLPAPTETLLYPYPLSFAFPTVRFLCEAWWTCWTAPGTHHTWRQRSDVLLATEEPLSVIVSQIRDGLGLAVTPEPGWTGPVPDWRGVPCTIGRARLWLPVEGGLPHRPFSLLVLLPRHDPPDVLPYVLLGVQFLLEYEATVTLACSQVPVDGRLRIP